LLTSGINMSTLSINQVIGTSLYVRNLTPFTGGRAAYTVKVVTPQDIQTAINAARSLVDSQKEDIQAFLAKPCKDTTLVSQTLIQLSWDCKFATYHIPSYMRVTAAHLSGKNFLVDVVFVPRPEPVWVK
jgi:methylaspartate ammonia-lyase